MQDLLNEFIGVLVRLTVIYVILGAICSFIVELISWVLHKRYFVLREAIQRTLGKTLQKSFFEHYLIQPLGRFPSYIPLWLFPIVVSDLLKLSAETPDLKDFKAAISLLRSQTKNELDRDKSIENWFKNILELGSDRYRAWVRNILFLLSFLLAIIFQFDTIKVINTTLKSHLGTKGSSSPDQIIVVKWLLNIGSFLEFIGFGFILTSLLICVGSIIAFNLLNRYAPLRGSWTGK